MWAAGCISVSVSVFPLPFSIQVGLPNHLLVYAVAPTICCFIKDGCGGGSRRDRRARVSQNGPKKTRQKLRIN
ncbi:hypothetical protein B0I72DRAFT_140720 [Yarrowia lipolytica]|uniref:Uncharacterized protein n=1 Tax=Yarrowia lipolytica TaxID=4952 RepID=A0A371C347_YARLL|nr:hypothetical protein BKA91DRAFT_142186 [Yarrowia lipolytica]KAE8170242.1 hypothetical protein BKA90DRAFT_141197 [Yarrowia lipolytica]RDW24749.1 hypothetical protein B0I71DRAFT_133742 [Yarrowia lipolytica]RDW30913.1 hypothetical protein B0I72DRAFT_140720 [Yarrowia lipolytica]RDW39216.1 hypothetical protein B0I73DRAFT_132392 [Yarrowia lipolytica]